MSKEKTILKVIDCVALVYIFQKNLDIISFNIKKNN